MSPYAQILGTKLIIPSVAKSDEGTYRCIASNIAGEVYTQVYVEVAGERASERASE